MTELLNHIRGDVTEMGLTTAETGPDGIDCLADENEKLTEEIKRLRKQVIRLNAALHECKTPLLALGETAIGGVLEVGAMAFRRIK